jgi:3-dehydroquinate synthase
MSASKGVVVCKDVVKALDGYLDSLVYDKLFVLVDEHTQAVCLPLVGNTLAMRKAVVFTVLSGDIHKDVEQLSRIWSFLSTQGASRNSILLNLGGGMVTDMGGFAAATFKRGIRTINIPTTLMASVDAAVGGKTAINFNGLKNEIGSFYPPLCVLIDCRFLQTLDRDNFLSGYAEMMKHALIDTSSHCDAIFSLDLGEVPVNDTFNRLVEASIAVKERIVVIDPKEEGLRKALNFGHTIGHALESLSFAKQRPLLHGHAVAAGLISELYLSHCCCGFPMSDLSRIVRYIKGYYPPFPFTCDDYPSLYDFMTHDKKNERGIINFTLLASIGDVCINQSIDKETILSSLDFYRESVGA